MWACGNDRSARGSRALGQSAADLLFESCSFDAFQQEQPIGKIWIHQHVQVGELYEKRRVPDPGDRHLAGLQFWEYWLFVFPSAMRQQGFPDQFAEKSAWVKVTRGRQFLQ